MVIAIWLLEPDISKAFYSVWYLGLLQTLKFWNFRTCCGPYVHEFVSNVFLWWINNLQNNVLCDIAISIDDTTFYSKFDWTSNLWQQLELVSETESDFQDTVGWGRNWLGNFNTQKTERFSFDQSNSWCYQCKSGCFCHWWIFPLDWTGLLVSITTTASKEIGILTFFFHSSEAVRYLKKCVVWPCIECFCHVWACAPYSYLNVLM